MAQSGPEKKKETKEAPKAEISLSSSIEDLIYAYLEEGKLIAASYIGDYIYYEHRKNQKSIEDWQKKLEAKSWPSDAQAFKEAKPNEFRKMLREQTLLGLIHFYSPIRNDALTIAGFRRAAEHEEPIAVFNLGFCYSCGSLGLPHNTAEAVRLVQNAANQGEPTSQRYIGQLCESGEWVTIPKNEEEAVHWYQQSAEQGHFPALINLARMYEIGHGGLTKDIGKAASLLSKIILQAQLMAITYNRARDQLNKLFETNQDHLLVAFYAAANLRKPKMIRQLNTLLIRLNQLAEEKKDPAATQQLHEFYQAAYGTSHKILLSILTDKNNLERWEQYVLKQALLEKRFSQVAQKDKTKGLPMPNLALMLLGFLGETTHQQRADIKTAAAQHRRAPDARQHVELIQAVLKGEFDADVLLYSKLQTEAGKSKVKSKPGKHEIRDYEMLEKLIKREGKKARSPIDLVVALGVLYYAAGDYSKAADQFLKASRAEDPRGYFYLGKMYGNGHLFRKNDGAAKECYAEAAKLTEEIKAKGEVKPGKSDALKR